MEDQVALVTGAGQGLGRAVAQRLLQDGWSVIGVEHDREAVRTAQRDLERWGRVHLLVGDVAREPVARRAVSLARSREGRLDLLVNNAGLMVESPVERLSLRDWRRVIDTNLTAAFLFAKHAAPLLRRSRGAIVNIASTRAYMSEPGTEAYAATKGGLVALTHALAISLGPDIRVNAVAPGWIDVSGFKKPSARKAAALRKQDHAQHPVGRVGIPEDVADAVLYLGGSKAGFVTGTTLVVDGGMTREMIYV
jgi:NAD(P)-dependent dehydrogenase (short-subunit alcohol dehydrogenase family)